MSPWLRSNVVYVLFSLIAESILTGLHQFDYSIFSITAMASAGLAQTGMLRVSLALHYSRLMRMILFIGVPCLLGL